MVSEIAVQTVLPILLLIGAGTLSRKIGILKTGDERVLSAYIYYFALPALFFVNLSEILIDWNNLHIILLGILPVGIILVFYVLLYHIFQIPKNMVFLLMITSIFGSLAFFGIPFITFAFPNTTAEHLATLIAATVSIVAVTCSTIILELHQANGKTNTDFKSIIIRIAKSPLIIFIVLGLIFSLLRIPIPSAITSVLHMLGSTTSTVAIFMLGVFFYGKKYTNLKLAFKLSLSRILIMPLIALLIMNIVGLPYLEKTILVIMHGTPIAAGLMVLSERYNFYKEVIASLTLITSISAAIHLTIWLLILTIFQ
jgi:predicted permease